MGDWFLYRDYTILRVYGFTGQPYRLPSFLTPRIFALEFMRQRLLSEEEHFGAFRKYLNIKFPFKVGPFIFKGKGALACIERLMENMDFVKDVNMNYDPHQVISLRKQANKNKPFEHQAVEGLAEMANLLQFTDESKTETETHPASRSEIQITEGVSVAVKRSLAEAENMEVDEETSRKKAKLLEGGDMVDEEMPSVSKKVALVPIKTVQVSQFSFKGSEGDVNSPESGPLFKSKEELKTSYLEKRKQSLEETRNLLPKVRNLYSSKTSLVAARDAEKNTFKMAIVNDKKMSEIEIRLDKISTPDKIQLHKQTSDILYSDLLQAMMRISKLQVLVDKLEVQLKHEKVENKANAVQIRKMQTDIASSDSTQAVKRLLEEKDNALQVLKKKLKIPGSEHVQSAELMALQEEKEKIHQEMMEYKGKAVELQEEKCRWEVEREELLSQISVLKKDQNDEKEIMEELMSQTPTDEDLSIVKIDKPLDNFSADDLLVSMSQVSLKDEEIRELTTENEKLKAELIKMSERKRQILQEKNQLQKKLEELKEKCIGKVPLQGAKHIIWDTLTIEITKFRHYLSFIDDLCTVTELAQQKLKLVNEHMARRPLSTAQNTLNFLNSLSYQKLHDMGIKDRISIVLSAKKIIQKHQLMKTVQDKSDELVVQVKEFRQEFRELFEDGLPSFWDEEGRLRSPEHYHQLLVRARMDHSKFNSLEKSLSGQTIVDILAEDFKVLQKFTVIRARLPKKSYETYMELEVTIREMMECDTPSSEQWKAVKRFGKTNYIVPS